MMKRPSGLQIPVLISVLAASLWLVTACTGSPSAPEAVVTNFGPDSSAQERAVRVFDALWDQLEGYYLHYGSEAADWDSIRVEYEQRAAAISTTSEFETLIRGLETELPAGALRWQSRAERLADDVAGSSASAGIGVFVAFKSEPSPRLIVLEVMKGSPADSAGVRAHDSITGIEDQAIAADEGLGAVDRIRGPAGSTVRLRVRTPGESGRLVAVERGQLDGKASLETAIVTGRDMGYLLFPAVAYDGLADDVVDGLSQLTRNRRLQGLILDLRTTGSAAGWPLPEMLTVFTNGLVGEFYDREQGRPVRVEGQNILNSQAVPLVVLIGEHTAGLPEVFAASLQANRRAVLVGTRTPGLVESESAFVLPDGSRMFFESGSFRLLGGREIGQTGVEPDVLVEAAWDEVMPDQDPLLAAAVAELSRTDE